MDQHSADRTASKLSSLIGQLATVHICDWLTKVKQIYAVLSADLWQLGPSCNKKENIPWT